MQLQCSRCKAEISPDSGLEAGDSCPKCGSPVVRVREAVEPDPDRARRVRAARAAAKEAADKPAPASSGRPSDSRIGKSGLAHEVESFGPYEIVEEVARGGMGVVYKAREKNLKRLVAIKVLLAGEGASDEEIRRFRREAEAASRLQHSNIVPIHTIGEVGGRHYFVMDFIEGKTVSDMIDDGELTPRMSLEIVEQVAQALDYAHQRGVIHRDMKPANIIIDHMGRPQIMDFGLAKQLDEDTGLTRSGTTMGTPAYMPPEQAEGDLAGIDAQSDVYALGAVLYEMLTGQPPFDGPTTMSILMKVLEEDPVAPRELNPRIHGDIDTICLKAMAKEKSRRYASAKELADDIRRFIAGEVIAASPAGLIYRLWKKMLRNKEVTAVVSAAFAALLVTLGWLAIRAHQEATQVRRERERRLYEELGAGNGLLEEGKMALDGDDSDGAEDRFMRARDAFQRALWIKHGDRDAKKRLDECQTHIQQIKVDYYLRLGRKFTDQQNYEAAQEMYRIVLHEYDRTNEAAKEGLRRAMGFCSLRVTTTPEGATAYLVTVNPTAARPPKGLGRSLGRTPVAVDDIKAGTYRLTLVKDGYCGDEIPIVLTRSQFLDLPEIELHPEPTGTANMVRVPAGTVNVGGRRIRVKEFYIDRYEYPNRWGQRPVTNVSWLEARRLSARQGKRLPTLAEWIRACQGDRVLAFPYGPEHKPNLCYDGRPGPTARAAPAGTHPQCVSQFGVYDMSGNVAEWVVDSSNSGSLAAGGNWSQTLPSSLMSTSTLFYPPSEGWAKVGFRCVKGEGEGLKLKPVKLEDEPPPAKR